jgi:UDP-GlcNAc:undecaprenyl-phosphate/decaprenyl-phosphate GlcNAc-1-phosphate transferase
MLFLLILCAAVSCVACGILLRLGRRNGRRYGHGMPQRFHTGHVPRLGGVAMMAACTAGWVWLAFSEAATDGAGPGHPPFSLAMTWWAVAIIAAAGGVGEDLTHRLTATWRLLFTIVAGAVATWLLGLSIPSLGIPPVQAAWSAAPWLGIALAVFAVAGLPHAFNLIDGYNGLAGIVSLICSLALGYVCLANGDRQLAAMVLVLSGSTVGFLVWNYPRGMIFAGDGGAYLWGVVTAVASVQLVQTHAGVSPWFPVLLLIYPVWETLFSIWRKLMRGQSPGVADALHFHQLIYRRIVRDVFDDDEARRMLLRNNRTSPYLWGFTVLTVIPAVLFWSNTPMLMFFTALFIVLYVWGYVSIVRFKVPRWLRR